MTPHMAARLQADDRRRLAHGPADEAAAGGRDLATQIGAGTTDVRAATMGRQPDGGPRTAQLRGPDPGQRRRVRSAERRRRRRTRRRHQALARPPAGAVSPRRRLDRGQRSRAAAASACVRSGASTMTRTSGSVPLGRSSTRPAPPSVGSAVGDRPPQRRSAQRPRPGRPRDVAQDLGQPRHGRARELGQRPARAGDDVEQLQPGEQAVAGGGQVAEDDVAATARRRGRCRRSARPRARSGRRPRSRRPSMPAASSASRSPRLLMTVTTTASPREHAPAAAGRWRRWR